MWTGLLKPDAHDSEDLLMFDPYEATQARTCATVLGILGTAALLIFALAHCGGTLPPVPCPPVCLTPLPTSGATPTPAASASPTPERSSTRTPTRSPTSTQPPASATPTATVPPTPFATTGGRAVIRLDLASFRVAPGPDGKPLDYYAAATLLWEPPGALKPEAPALELSIRGTSDEHCLASPCGPTALGLVARWSANIRHDAGEPDERRHCGEGINYKFRLPVGPGPTTDVTVDWGPHLVRVATVWGAWTAKRGVMYPGFGRFYAGIAGAPRGIGWAREPWSVQSHGGTAVLLSWQVVEPLAVLSRCP